MKFFLEDIRERI